MARTRKPKDKYLTLREAHYGPIQLGNTKGRMIAAQNPPGALFLHVDGNGALCTVPWEEALRRFGPPKNRA